MGGSQTKGPAIYAVAAAVVVSLVVWQLTGRYLLLIVLPLSVVFVMGMIQWAMAVRHDLEAED